EKEKQAIARAASKFVTANDSIIIGSGTTTQFLAREIVPQGHLTVVTSALNVTFELLKHANVEVIQLGGSVRHTSSSVTGLYAMQILDQFYCSKLFLGVCGIDLDYGISRSEEHTSELQSRENL